MNQLMDELPSLVNLEIIRIRFEPPNPLSVTSIFSPLAWRVAWTVGTTS